MLRTLQLSEEGGRYECRDRLLTVLAAHQAVKLGNRPALMLEVQQPRTGGLRAGAAVRVWMRGGGAWNTLTFGMRVESST